MCRAGEPDVRLTDQKLITIPGQMPGLNASVIFHLINEVTIWQLICNLLCRPGHRTGSWHWAVICENLHWPALASTAMD